MKAMSSRQQKVALEVQRTIAMALLQGRVHSTLPLARLTLVTCWVSPDLRLARLYLQMPDSLPQAETIATANAELSKPLRKFLAENLATKFIPQLTFFPAEEQGPHVPHLPA